MKLKRLLALTASSFLALSLAVIPNISFAEGLDRDWNGNLYPYRYGWVHMKEVWGNRRVHAFWTTNDPSDPWGAGGGQGGYQHRCDYKRSWDSVSYTHATFTQHAELYTVWACNLYEDANKSNWDGWQGDIAARYVEGRTSDGIRAGYWKNDNSLHWTYPISWWGGPTLMDDNSTASMTDWQDPSQPTISGAPSGWSRGAVTLYANSVDSGTHYVSWNANTTMPVKQDEWKRQWAGRYDAQVSGVNHYEYAVGYGGWSGLPMGTNSIWYGTPGTSTIRFRAVDNTRRNSAVSEVVVNIDDRAPQITVNAPNNGWTTSVNISISTKDENSNGSVGSGVSRIEWQLAGNGGWQSIYSTTGNITVTKNGTYLFRAWDNAGWVSNTVTVVVNNVDDIPPVVTVDWNKKPVKETDLIIKATDVGGGIVNWAITNSPQMPSSWTNIPATNTFNTTHHIEENKKYYIHVRDVSGNHAVALADVKSLDRYVPVFTEIQVKGGS